MRIWLLAALIGTHAVTAFPALAQKSPEKIRLTAASKDGAVLIRVPVEPFAYSLQFSRNGNSGFMSRVYLMTIKGGAAGYRFIARTLSPGRYRLDSIWQQGHWSACLEQGTFEFEVKAGTISYVGTLQTERLLASIQMQALLSGKATVLGTDYMLSHGPTEKPIIDGRDEIALAEARQFADTTMNGSARLVDLANVTDTRFTTSGFGKAIKICG